MDRRRAPGRNPFVSGLNAGVLLKFLTNSPQREPRLDIFLSSTALIYYYYI